MRPTLRALAGGVPPDPPSLDDRLLTARVVAGRLGVSAQTVLRWARAGKLPGYRLPSGQLRFSEGELALWLAERRT